MRMTLLWECIKLKPIALGISRLLIARGGLGRMCGTWNRILDTQSGEVVSSTSEPNAGRQSKDTKLIGVAT
ncbi:hypothetical protein K474DRAFT_1287562 [Panus rudis PR-1116 ss-1]|nr:hypothetical protein K474DRAFT_1287562 [Panus rudis PR-1116 ss-1]